MILFYDKRNGDIFATIDGRVHGKKQLESYVNSGIGEKNIGKYIIGWIDNGIDKIECNMDKFEILKKFEDNSPENPMDYKIDIEKVELVKK